MQDYIKLDFKLQNPDFSEVLISLLSEHEAFGGFEELGNGELSSHIEAGYFGSELQDFIQAQQETVDFSWSHSQVAAQNWNAVWESNYEPVEVTDFCRIRAAFHQPKTGFTHEILITPKMSFGTGHHATTYSVMKLMQTVDFNQKKVLDYGSGTGVLAILAAKMGAKLVEAVDVEEWAYHNSVENAELNHTEDILIQQGDIFAVKNDQFDIILANINRNVLLDTMPYVAALLKTGGTLILSGFYMEKDSPIILQRAAEFGLKLQKSEEKEQWAALLLQK